MSQKAPFSAADEAFMLRALALARRGQGQVEPNPMVGCVLTAGGRELAEGFHTRFGGPHAEVEALRAAPPRRVHGATAYVTLEPCCYSGKTPPCTEALIAAGIRRVVTAVRDPNPRVAGRGIDRLRAAGIRVEEGLCAAIGRDLIAPFTKLMQTGRPWVILKWAQSLDGKIATRTGDSRWISDPTQRAHAHVVRGRVDAILVGVQTVLTDDPRLTCRDGPLLRQAVRVVLDTRLRTPPTSRLAQTARATPVLIFCGPAATAARQRALERRGCEVVRVRAVAGGVSLPAVLDALGARSLTNLVVEGGAHVLGAFHAAGLADEYHVYVAPLLIGGAAAPGPLGGRGPAHIVEAFRAAESGGRAPRSEAAREFIRDKAALSQKTPSRSARRRPKKSLGAGVSSDHGTVSENPIVYSARTPLESAAGTLTEPSSQHDGSPPPGVWHVRPLGSGWLWHYRRPPAV